MTLFSQSLTCIGAVDLTVDAAGVAEGTITCDATDDSFPCTSVVSGISVLTGVNQPIYIAPCLEDSGTLWMEWSPPDTIEGTVYCSSGGPVIYDVAFNVDRLPAD